MASQPPGTTAGEKSWAGNDPAPAFPGGLTWFNVEHPLTLDELKGKVVLLDFWTLGCINCQQIIPDLDHLEQDFGNKLVVIGVHSGKYSTEHDDDSIRDAIKKYGLDHPVVNDPDFAVWNLYGANAWPTLVLIDPAGNLVGGHAGEGVYPLFQPIVASLVKEFSAKGQVTETAIPLALEGDTVTSTVLSFPGKVLADPKGQRIFIADSDHNRILIAGLGGNLLEAIGSGKEGFEDGAKDEAAFRQPQGLALSPDGGTLYVADTRNHAIRAVTLSTGEVTTIAGTGQQLEALPSAGAKATETALASPWDVVDVGNTLFITMAGVHQIWALDLKAGTISVFAGTSREGIDDGNRLNTATLAQPSGIVSDGTNLYWVDPESSSVRELAVDGKGDVRTIVGTGLFDYGDKDGQGTSAKLQHAQGIAISGSTLYVSDTYNHEIRAVDLVSHNVTTLAGDGDRGWVDATGAAARFNEPGGASVANGKLYVADTNNNVIRAVDTTTEAVTTLNLTNLSVATAPSSSKPFTVDAPAQSAAPGTGVLTITVQAPAGHHLNSQAPSSLSFSASDASVVALQQTTATWSTDDGAVTVSLPLALKAGTSTLTGKGSIYYCRTGEEALCFIQQVQVTAPVTVTEGGSDSVAVTVALPPGTT